MPLTGTCRMEFLLSVAPGMIKKMASRSLVARPWKNQSVEGGEALSSVRNLEVCRIVRLARSSSECRRSAAAISHQKARALGAQETFRFNRFRVVAMHLVSSDSRRSAGGRATQAAGVSDQRHGATDQTANHHLEQDEAKSQKTSLDTDTTIAFSHISRPPIVVARCRESMAGGKSRHNLGFSLCSWKPLQRLTH